MRKDYSDSCKAVMQLNCNGDVVAEYPSIGAASLSTGFARSSISCSCRRISGFLRVNGFRFVFEEDYDPAYDYSFDVGNSKPVHQYTLQGELLKVYPSIKDAGSSFQSAHAKNKIGECCRGERSTYKGFVWKFAKECKK